MKFFSISLVILISYVLSTEAAEYCETAECVNLAENMKSFMNESINPCDDFYEYVCGNFSSNYNSAILDQYYGNIYELGDIMKTITPNGSNEKVALTVFQKCVNDKSDNLDTFMKDFWDDTDDLTKLIIEITKLKREKGGLFKNEIFDRKTTGEKGYSIIMSLKETPKDEYTFNNVSLEDAVSRVKFMNLTEYFYHLLPEDHRRYGALDDSIVFDDSFFTIDAKVEELGKAKTKALLFLEWKDILKEYAEERSDMQCAQNNMFTLFPGTTTKLLLGKVLKEENLKTTETIFKMLQREANEIIEESTWLDEETKLRMLMELNSVAVSIAITSFYTRLPFIDKNLPEWSILASLSHIIGHEIGHMFDPQRFWLNKTSEISILPIEIDPKTGEEYIRRTTCLVEKYNEFKFPGFDIKLDGSRTLLENFADQFGFQLAYRLFKKLPDDSQKLRGFGNSTLDQQFFLRMSTTWCGKKMDLNMIQKSVRDGHSPAMFRINGIVSNSDEFATTFGCAKSTAMNPEKKCELF